MPDESVSRCLALALASPFFPFRLALRRKAPYRGGRSWSLLISHLIAGVASMFPRDRSTSLVLGIVVMGFLAVLQAAAQGRGGKRPEATGATDTFDRPIRWTEPVGGARVSLHMMRTRLAYGE